MAQPPRLPRAFAYSPAEGLGYQPGVTRRDPSPVIEVEGVFHVWYSRATHDASGYYASIYHATSADGHRWTERGEAVGKGGRGAWDANGVFTPTTLIANERYHLLYTAVPEPFTNDDGGPGGTPTAIGIASASSPLGPWVKFADNPILTPGPAGAFDSHRVDDACVVARGGAYWLYFKGRERGRTPGETKMGLAVAASPTGPYVKSTHNPVLDSGHEVCVWPSGGGVAALVMAVGPQGRTVQYADDGVHFNKVADIQPPSAPGPLRGDGYVPGRSLDLTWGLCQVHKHDRPHLMRFDVTA